MPLCFTFVKAVPPNAGEPVKLDDVDREICREFGRIYSERDFCMEYQVITMMGLAILATEKCDPVTPEAFESYVKKNENVHREDAENAKFKKFLCGDYSFHGWYQRHK
jgi:hypothetical protein